MIKPTEVVELPVGLEVEGVRYKKVTISEMNGYDEENLASRKVRNNGAKAQTILLRRCIQEIEGLVPKKSNPNDLIKEDYLLKMCSYDRDYLFFCIRSLGGVPDIDFQYECPACDATNYSTISVEDLEVYEWPENEPLAIPFEMRNGLFQDDKMHKEGQWNFLTGKQQEEIAKVPNERIVNASMRMCIKRIGEIDNPTEEQVKRLSTTERNDLLEQVSNEAPGVQTSLSFECEHCGEQNEQALDISRFFKSPAKTKNNHKPNGKRGRRMLRTH